MVGIELERQLNGGKRLHQVASHAQGDGARHENFRMRRRCGFGLRDQRKRFLEVSSPEGLTRLRQELGGGGVKLGGHVAKHRTEGSIFAPVPPQSSGS